MEMGQVNLITLKMEAVTKIIKKKSQSCYLLNRKFFKVPARCIIY